jgi:5-methylthioribose kinase
MVTAFTQWPHDMPSILSAFVAIGLLAAELPDHTPEGYAWRQYTPPFPAILAAVYVATVDLESLSGFLQVRGWIAPGAHVVERALLGEGAGVATIRITTDGGATRILRQPGTDTPDDTRHVPPPADRLAIEGEFYRLVQDWPAVSDRMPACLGADRTERLVALEDLGAAAPLANLYMGAHLRPEDVDALCAYLVALHGIPADTYVQDVLLRDGVRLAQHAERFEDPMSAARVEALAARVPRLDRQVDALRTDVHIRAAMRDIGSRFLEGSGTLLHGDFRPARWMPSPRGLRVLSPGLASTGPAALDLGYFVAHLMLAGQPHALVSGVLSRYRRDTAVDLMDVSACVGLEIIRGRLGRDPVPGLPSADRLEAELEYATRLLRGRATVELPL